MIVASPALDKVLREFVPSDRITDVSCISHKVRQALLEVAQPVGCLRWACYREGLELDLKSLPYEQFVDAKTLTTNTHTMIACVCVSARAIHLTQNQLEHKVRQLLLQKADPWLVCQGHDLVGLMHIVLPSILEKRFGRQAAQQSKGRTRADSLDPALRVAYERGYFINTQLYMEIQNWEASNTPYKVLDSL